MPPAPAPAIDHTTLSDLPAATLHRILSDIPISSIVSFAATNNPHITACILSHPTHSIHFPTAAALETAVAYHQLLAAVGAVRGRGTAFAAEIIDSIYNTLYIHNPLKWLHARTVAEINALAPDDVSYFRLFAPPASNVWDASSLPRLQARFQEVVRNSARLQAEKAAQVRRIHVLCEVYAERLKAKMDPSQEPRPRRPPLLERLAKQMEWLEAAVPRKRGRSGGAVRVWRNLGRWVPVPYDRYLVMVLKVLRRWPLADEAMPGMVVPAAEVEGKRPKGVRAVEVVEEWFDEGETTYSVVPAAAAAAAAGGGEEKKEEKAEEEEEEEGKGPTATAAADDTKGTVTTTTWTKKIKYLPPSPRRPHAHVYTASAIRNIRTALIGLKYTYAVPGILPRPRTMYTPYSAAEHQSVQRTMQPCFAMPEGRGEPLAYALNNKELDWLEAFLACCDYMSEMQETWVEGMTVQEWWRERELGCR